MSVVDARLRVHHPCPYCDISTEFPHSLILLWCDNRRDTFLVSSPNVAELTAVVKALKESLNAEVLLEDGADAIVLIPEFEWTDPPSVTGLARRSKVWVLHPVVYFGGKETYRMIAPSRSELDHLVRQVRRLGEVELLSVSDRAGLQSVRDLPTTVVHFFEGLTNRQAHCLIAAFEGGLLDVPARSSWSEVARRQGLSRSTFGEHLRKGQLHLLENSYSALKARARTPEVPEVLPALPAKRRARRNPLGAWREGSFELGSETEVDSLEETPGRRPRSETQRAR